MASAPQQSLPLFYNELEPLSSQQHADFQDPRRRQGAVPRQAARGAGHRGGIPAGAALHADRLSQGEEPVPLALMGLNEGINTFFDEDGSLNETNFYVPAYVRRYPYLLARLRPDSDELSLCFDPTSTRSARSTRARPCSSTASRATPPRTSCSSTSSSSRPAPARASSCRSSRSSTC